MSSPQLPNLTSIHQQLLQDTQTIESFIYSLPLDVEELLALAEKQDWIQAKSRCKSLLAAADACTLPEVTARVSEVQQAIEADNFALAQRKISSLANAGGKAKISMNKQPAKESDSNRL